jgi:hypothetical protein
VSYRPLVFVTGLTVGDYLLWNWSLNGNHDVLALVSGLTLPPLAVACLWLLAMSVARLIAATARRPGWRAARARRTARGKIGRRQARRTSRERQHARRQLLAQDRSLSDSSGR